MVSVMVSFCAVLFIPRGVLDEILNLIESVSEGFSSYSVTYVRKNNPGRLQFVTY